MMGGRVGKRAEREGKTENGQGADGLGADPHSSTVAVCP